MLNEKESGVPAALVVACFLLFALFLFDFQFVRQFMAVEVSGGSMETTLFDGDVLYADRFKTPKRGDVVIINVENYRAQFGFRGDFIIKRLIAVEGDSVYCKEGSVYVRRAGFLEYSKIEEPYTGDFVTEDFEEVKVGEGEIFFLGDHRTNSADSRTVGCLKMKDVAGVVPAWSIKMKSAIKGFENFRNLFAVR